MNSQKREGAPRFSPQLFKDPPSRLRGAPFWSWNGRLQKERLLRQVGFFAEMGIGGFTIHARTGLDTPYLGEEFISYVKTCVEEAKRRGMHAWLYDEDRWPSGFAGGMVTQNPEHRVKYLRLTTQPAIKRGSGGPDGGNGPLCGPGSMTASWAVDLDSKGCLNAYRKLEGREEAGAQKGAIWYAYLETPAPEAWYSHQTYADTLSRAAVERFIDVTHERYRMAVGEEFGKTVPAIFTDEPQFFRQEFLQLPDDGQARLAWTTDFADTFRTACGFDILDRLPEVLWDLPDKKPSLARYRYHDHLAERFASAFADTIGQWCDKHGIALTGHLMDEHTLDSQTRVLGEAMRSYRSFQIPGIDILVDGQEITTAKQAQSAKHQYGRTDMLSELYGVTDWDFPFAGYKSQGDWQAALGVSIRVHHLAWMSMEGEAKRDYPASIFYQSPWFQEYRLIEDHFARVNTALASGRPQVRVGVIHPIESYWLACGPREQTKLEREQRNGQFQDLASWLVRGLIDFDFISESLLPEQSSPEQGGKLSVGHMAYDLVILPGLKTVRATTLERIESFRKAGGQVLFLGEIPSFVDAESSDRARRLAERSLCLSHSEALLLQALEPVREVDCLTPDGGRVFGLCSQLRCDGEQRILFLCNPDRAIGWEDVRVRLRGSWSVEELDTFQGDIRPVREQHDSGWTEIICPLPAAGHALLRFSPPSRPAAVSIISLPNWGEPTELVDPVPITMSEPNVLLLDQAQWRLNGGEWRPREELLRIDNLVRTAVGLGERDGDICQPWADTSPAPNLGRVEIRFQITAEIAVSNGKLAIEQPGEWQIRLNGLPLSNQDDGWWVDEDIRTVPLPELPAGENILELAVDYSRLTSLEWIYLLGNFGVRLAGRHACLTTPVDQLAWGDWTTQGLPFYTGNVTYHAKVTGSNEYGRLAAPHFRNPLLRVALNGCDVGPIAFAPWRIDLGYLKPNVHQLDITALGNRRNAFGCVHQVDPRRRWIGPNAWRTTGEKWAYEYQLKPIGILTAPSIWKRLPQAQ